MVTAMGVMATMINHIFPRFSGLKKLKGGLAKMVFWTREKSKRKVDLSQVKAELCLRRSYDKTGYNLCVNVSNHPDEAKNRRHYILRVLDSGEIVVFKGNKDIGLQTDEHGQVLVNLKTDSESCDSCEGYC